MKVLPLLSKETIGSKVMWGRLSAIGSTSKLGIHTRLKETKEEEDFLASTTSKTSWLSHHQWEKELHWKIFPRNFNHRILRMFPNCNNNHIKNLVKAKSLMSRKTRTIGEKRGIMRTQRESSLDWSESQINVVS